MNVMRKASFAADQLSAAADPSLPHDERDARICKLMQHRNGTTVDELMRMTGLSSAVVRGAIRRLIADGWNISVAPREGSAKPAYHINISADPVLRAEHALAGSATGHHPRPGVRDVSPG